MPTSTKEFFIAATAFRVTQDPEVRHQARIELIHFALNDDAIGNRAADLLLAEEGITILRPPANTIVEAAI